MKKLIVTEEQLNEYVEHKKAKKTFNSILGDMNKNSRFLSEQISVEKANQTVIENYGRKKLLSPRVMKMLVEHGLTNEDGQIL